MCIHYEMKGIFGSGRAEVTFYSDQRIAARSATSKVPILHFLRMAGRTARFTGGKE
jgi:hypothetical protein